MINYVEKGIGLHEAINAAGHWLEQRDGLWVSDDDEAVQQIIDGYTVNSAKSTTCAKVVELATLKFNEAVASYSAGELAGWAILRAEAEAYTKDSTAATPSISLEADIRGVDVPTLVTKVLANANYFDKLRAQIAGTSGRHRDAVMALQSMEEVVSYDYTTGWPGV